MPSSPAPPYSTLEVDIVAQQKNEQRATVERGTNKPLPELWVPWADKDANAPQVAGDGIYPIPRLPDESAPQAIDNYTLPEPVPFSLPSRARGEGPNRRLCGLKRRIFWILVAVVTTAVIAIAIGAGVGASTSKQSSSASKTTLLSTSRLAAINFTADGVDYNCVYYQLKSGEIYQSVWDSNTTAWKVFAVATDTKNILDNTPISADLYWRSDNEHRHHVFYYDADQRIRGKSADTPYTNVWDDNNGINDKGYTGNGISLASYAKECDTCYNANAVVYDDGNLQYATPKTDSGQLAWNQNPFPAGLPKPANGTQLTLKPLYNGTADGGKFIVLFMVSAHGNLAKLLYDGNDWEGENLDINAVSNSAIAAFTTGTFVNGSEANSNYTLQLLNTHPGKASGGVTLSSYSSSSPEWKSSKLDFGFQNVLNGSGLAANQAGKVYGTVMSRPGTPEIMEWSWNRGNGSYTMIGLVNTTLTT